MVSTLIYLAKRYGVCSLDTHCFCPYHSQMGVKNIERRSLSEKQIQKVFSFFFQINIYMYYHLSTSFYIFIKKF